jgi:hypothetical protein
MTFIVQCSTMGLLAGLVCVVACAGCGGISVAPDTSGKAGAQGVGGGSAVGGAPGAGGSDAGAVVPIADAAVEQSISSSIACDQCLFSQPGASGCGTEMGACFDNATCKSLMLCALASPCHAISDPQARNICQLPCATDAGVTSASDPALVPAYAVQSCMDQNCPACSVAR